MLFNQYLAPDNIQKILKKLNWENNIDIPEINNANIEPEIKLVACAIFNYILKKLGKRRSNNKKKMIIFSVYNAYLEVRNPRPLEQLCRIFNIDYKFGKESLTFCSEANTNYNKVKIKINSIHFIYWYLHDLPLNPNDKDNIKELNKNIVIKDLNTIEKNLDKSNPRAVALSVILYYLFTHGIRLSNKELNVDILRKIGSISGTKLNQILNIIWQIDNN